jgi:hypothetical protein
MGSLTCSFVTREELCKRGWIAMQEVGDVGERCDTKIDCPSDESTAAFRTSGGWQIDATDLHVGSLYASVGSLNALVAVDLKTGVVTPVVSNLKGPHGLQFVPRTEHDDEDSQDD